MGLAHKIGHPQLLQVHHRKHGSGQIVADGDDGAVEVPHTQGTEHLFVLSIPHNGVGHVIGDLLHQVCPDIHGQDLRSQLAQILCQAGTEPAQADHNIRFHSILLIRSAGWFPRNGTAPPPGCP